jgi:hypothetical protein
MKIETHTLTGIRIAQIRAQVIVIKSESDGLDLLGNLYYEGFAGIIIHEHNITPDFFDLKNGMAGAILQKFSNYRMRLVIVGDFEKYPGKSLRDFIYESNKGKQINFVNSPSEALNRLKT